MNITIKEDAIKSQENWTWLDRILHRIQDGAHEWEISDPDLYENSEWYKHSRQEYREIFENAAKKCSYPSTEKMGRSIVVSASPAKDEFTPKVAAQFSQTPLYILMENKFTDGILLDSAIEFLGPKNLTKKINEKIFNFIEYVGVGGNGELPKNIEDRIKISVESGIPARLIVFTDSDKTHPNDVQKNAFLVGASCEMHGVPYCILTKRSIENYIPDEIFKKWCSLENNKTYKTKIDSLLSLTQDQRDYISIKKGINLKSGKPLLFSDVEEDNLKPLEIGFGDNVIEWLKSHKEVLNEKVLRARDHSGDLDKIINLIAINI